MLPSSIGEPLDQSVPVTRDFHFWYPSWETWQFRRTLTYWIAIMFGEGSILFVIGACFAMSGITDAPSSVPSHTRELVLVNTPYCIGALAFTLGAYCGVLEIINLPNTDDESLKFFIAGRRHLQRVSNMVDLKSLGSYSINFVGAIAFNIDTLAAYFEMPYWSTLLLTWGMATVGGAAFTTGGILDCLNNKAWKFDVCTAQWWVSVGNTIGGVCFLIPGIAGLCSPPSAVYYWVVDFIYLVGSLGFLFASIFLLWMWKNEQYGLGRLPELNGVARPDAIPSGVLDFHAEYGCGKSSATQIPWLLMYEVNASLSVVDVAVALGVRSPDPESAWLNAMNAALNFALSHGILLLGSVIHHIPTKRPFNWLLMYMRGVLLFYTLHSAWSVSEQIRKSVMPRP